MTLSVIRNLFPEPTPEQEMLIGPSCLVLTDGQRRSITSINLDVYKNDPVYEKAISARIDSAVRNGKIKGVVIGAATGAAAGAIGAVAVTSQMGNQGKAIMPFAVAGGVIVGGSAGAIAGYHIGGEN